MDNNILFSQHALLRMFEREISPDLVKKAILDGSVISEYPNDFPYPSRPILSGWRQGNTYCNRS